MSTFLGFFIYMFDGPLFKSVNGLIKEKVTHFVFFFLKQTVPTQEKGKKSLNSYNFGRENE